MQIAGLKLLSWITIVLNTFDFTLLKFTVCLFFSPRCRAFNPYSVVCRPRARFAHIYTVRSHQRANNVNCLMFHLITDSEFYLSIRINLKSFDVSSMNCYRLNAAHILSRTSISMNWNCAALCSNRLKLPLYTTFNSQSHNIFSLSTYESVSN